MKIILIALFLVSCSQTPAPKRVDPEQFRRELRKSLKNNREQFEFKYKAKIMRLTEAVGE